MKTLIAIIQGMRLLFIAVLVVLALILFTPPLYDWASDKVGAETRMRISIGVSLLAIIQEYARNRLMRQRQSALARAILRLSPGLRHREAIVILIQALESPDESVSHDAHEELVRITNQDLGTDPEAWRGWLKHQQRSAGIDL